MTARRPPYVEGALIEGFAAHVFDRVLARHLPAYLGPFSAEQRAAVDAARAAVKRAADRYEQRPLSAVNGSAATQGAETSADSAHEWISTSEAAVMLGVHERRARQLAAGGMGRKIGRAWLLDRSMVLAYRDERRSA
jgi:hypothetical protein